MRVKEWVVIFVNDISILALLKTEQIHTFVIYLVIFYAIVPRSLHMDFQQENENLDILMIPERHTYERILKAHAFVLYINV